VTAVPSPLPVVVESSRRFPAAVEDELERRRIHLLAAAEGEVLDLDRPDARALVAGAAAGRRVEHTFSTALSVGQLVRFPDLAAAVRGIDRLVGPGGRLLIVEPVGRPGLVPLFLDSLWAAAPSIRGFHLARDVPAALRVTTFTLDDIERFTMPTPVTSLHHFVEVHAVRRVEAAAAPAEVQEVPA
jgi:SAM-dependent methyltransferase